MRTANCEVRVLVKGRPVTEFKHENQTFIEGRGGSEFEIEIRNNTGRRIMAVISVDGLSVINGDTAGPESPGYLINAYQAITIPGWKLTSQEAAKFTFSGRKDSYAQLGTGNAKNCGVIGVMVWSEKVQQIVRPAAIAKGAGGSWNGPVYGGPLSDSYGTYKGSPSIGGSLGNWSAGASAGDVQSSYGMRSAYNASIMNAAASLESTTLSSAVATSATVNNLGTEFGKATQFATVESTFNKDAVIDTLVLYYDDAKGLKARGIVLERPSRQQYSSTPDPFPGMSCTPPKGWRG